MRLGDGDAVSVGDYHLPAVVGYILGEGARGSGRRRADYTDAEMLTLLEPFAPHRGRVDPPAGVRRGARLRRLAAPPCPPRGAVGPPLLVIAAACGGDAARS